MKEKVLSTVRALTVPIPVKYMFIDVDAYKFKCFGT